MNNLKGKTAFITGGAEGIGFCAGRSLAKEGMNVMLSDINNDLLDESVKKLKSEGLNVEGLGCDVSVKSELEAAAKKTVDTFGKVHVLINNAAVSVIGAQKQISENDWRWILDVNILGVVFGTQVFMPLIKSHGEGGHIMNVASVAGINGISFGSPYCATKAAVISLTESWRTEFARDNIVVSVLCPGFFKTRIYDSMRNRQQRFGGPVHFDDLVKSAPHLALNKNEVTGGINPEIAGERVVEAIKNDEFYVFTHPHFRDLLEIRTKNLTEGFDRTDSSPALKDVPRHGTIIR